MSTQPNSLAVMADMQGFLNEVQASDRAWRLRNDVVAARADVAALVEAARAARSFIRNGIALGYIRMPDADCPDPAHAVPAQLDAALAPFPR